MTAWHRFLYRTAVSVREYGERKGKAWIIRLAYIIAGRVW